MKYLGSEPFSVGGPQRVMAGTCEACTWGRGEHAAGCVRRIWSDYMREHGAEDWDAWEQAEE